MQDVPTKQEVPYLKSMYEATCDSKQDNNIGRAFCVMLKCRILKGGGEDRLVTVNLFPNQLTDFFKNNQDER
jgi:hypothetical protein